MKWLNRWRGETGGGQRSGEEHRLQGVTALLGAEPGQISPAALCGPPQAGGSLGETERGVVNMQNSLHMRHHKFEMPDRQFVSTLNVLCRISGSKLLSFLQIIYL